MTTTVSLAPAPRDFGAPGSVPFGRYAGALGDESTARFDGGTGLFSRRRLQRKGWLYFGAFSPRYMIGIATVDAGVVGTGFVYVYDREKKKLVEEKATAPLGFPAGFEPRLRGPWRFTRGGRAWEIAPDGEGWNVRFRGKRVELGMRFGAAPGMTSISPVVGRPFHHTYKACTLPVHVTVTVDGDHGEVAGEGVVDFTLGYPARHTTWNWASVAGQTADGRRFGANLVAHFHNGVENAIWLGDEIVPLAQATFIYDQSNVLSPWRVRTEDGVVDLTVFPEGERKEHLNAGLMVSNFTQPFGRVEGTVNSAKGPISLKGFGVVEQHVAVW
jgi:hypothetical protein